MIRGKAGWHWAFCMEKTLAPTKSLIIKCTPATPLVQKCAFDVLCVQVDLQMDRKWLFPATIRNPHATFPTQQIGCANFTKLTFFFYLSLSYIMCRLVFMPSKKNKKRKKRKEKKNMNTVSHQPLHKPYWFLSRYGPAALKIRNSAKPGYTVHPEYFMCVCGFALLTYGDFRSHV